MTSTPTPQRRPQPQPPQQQPPPPADLRLLAAAVTAWATVAVTVSWASGVRLVLLAFLGALTGAAWLLHRRGERRRRHRRAGRHARARGLGAALLLVTAAVSLLQLAATGHDLRQRQGPLDDLTAQRASVTVVGTVVTDPRVLTSRFGDETILLTLDVREVSGRGSQHAAYAPVLVRGGDELRAARWWSTVQLSGRLRTPSEPGPHLADLRATGAPVERAPPHVIARAAEHLRSGLRGSVAGLPGDARGLLPGLVIGDTSGVPPDLDEAMRTTGMTHLTAVSGSNVAVVTGLAFAGCALIGMPRRWRPWVALVLLGGFVVLARPEPSVIRAAVMGAIGLIGISRHHRSAGLPVLGGAILAVLTWDPWLARSYGFVLSTLATLGLLIFAGPWGEAIGRRLPRRARLLGPAVAVPLAAQVVCGPIIVLLQGSVSVVAVVANLLAVPLVPIATIGGVACAGVALVSPTLAGWLAWVPGLPTLGIVRIARALAVVPGATVPWPDGAWGAVLLTVVTILVLLVGRSVLSAALADPLAAIVLCVVGVALLTPTRTVTWPDAGWRLVVCDVGQGDGIVVRSGPHSAVVVDVGPDPDLIDGCLDRLGVQVVDAVVLTHFHADHVDGLRGVDRGRSVRAIHTTDVAEPEAQARAVQQWARGVGLGTQPLRAGATLTAGEFTASVWGPVRRIAAGSVANNASVVLAVESGGARALLLGDIEREAGAALLAQVRRDPAVAGQSRGFDVVKTPHHGSANIDRDFLAAVRAPVAVVSVGADNDYGHPARSHLEVLRQLGFATYRTDLRGDIALVRTAAGFSIATSR
jgi:competence protein ComEC